MLSISVCNVNVAVQRNVILLAFLHNLLEFFLLLSLQLKGNLVGRYFKSMSRVCILHKIGFVQTSFFINIIRELIKLIIIPCTYGSMYQTMKINDKLWKRCVGAKGKKRKTHVEK